MSSLNTILAFLPHWMFALLRFLPLCLMPAFTPFTWAPLHVRVFLLVALASLGASVMPASVDRLSLGAAISELVVGGCFALAIMLPIAASGVPARLVDVQAGLASANLFNPGLQSTDSLIGTVVSLAATFVFFALGFHLLLIRALVSSARWLPLGSTLTLAGPGPFLTLLGSQFLLGLMVVMPCVLGLFAVDVAIAFASRSMPQANIYFLALPIKVGAVIVLLAASLRLAPTLMGRLFADALVRAPRLLVH